MNDIRSLNSLEDITFAVNRIEELEEENKRLKSLIADVINDTGDDPEIMAASRAEWAARALTAEAKLAKAVGLVDDMVEWGTWYGEALKEILHRLAELKGEK